jgi:ribonuclease HI
VAQPWGATLRVDYYMKLILFADGGSRGNPGPSAAGAVLFDTKRKKIAEIKKFLGHATSNQAEYSAALLGIKKAQMLGATEIEIFLDSKLVVEQLAGNWKIKDLHLKKIAEKIQTQLAQFENWKIKHVPRTQNREADRLVNEALNLNDQ